MISGERVYGNGCYVVDLGGSVVEENTIEDEEIPDKLLGIILELGSTLDGHGILAEQTSVYRTCIGWVVDSETYDNGPSRITRYGNFYINSSIPIDSTEGEIQDMVSLVERAFSCVEKEFGSVVSLSFYANQCGSVVAEGGDASELSEVFVSEGSVCALDTTGVISFASDSYGRLYACYPTSCTSVAEAKENIVDSIMEAAEELGTSVPPGAIGFRLGSDISYVAVKFDSSETIMRFREVLEEMDPCAEWDWGDVRRSGDDWVLVGKFWV